MTLQYSRLGPGSTWPLTRREKERDREREERRQELKQEKWRSWRNSGGGGFGGGRVCWSLQRQRLLKKRNRNLIEYKWVMPPIIPLSLCSLNELKLDWTAGLWGTNTVLKSGLPVTSASKHRALLYHSFICDNKLINSPEMNTVISFYMLMEQRTRKWVWALLPLLLLGGLECDGQWVPNHRLSPFYQTDTISLDRFNLVSQAL